MAMSRRRKSLIAVAVVGVSILVILQLLNPSQEQPITGASPTPSFSRIPASAVATSPSRIPFEGNGNGTFEVISHEWTSQGLEVTLRVTLDKGRAGFSLSAYNNDSMRYVGSENISTFTVDSAHPWQQTVLFATPQGDSTIVLHTQDGYALTALPISV